ncbi:MAG: DsbC family protein [Gammaproteobacteria bacterium]|nr:DsbC family protein [Gammaproteobacteria bacterium]NND54643.1 DsbC family protein [Gammaproteobacteria bacterium]
MKTTIQSLLTGLALAGLQISAAQAALPAEYEFVTEALPGLEIELVQPAPVPGYLELHSGPNIFYMSEDGKHLFVGSLVDIETETDLTEASKAKKRLGYVNKFDDSESIVFAADNEIAEVVVFTDIDCGYCRKLHREIANYNEAGISIRYLFFPRSGPGTSSWKKAQDVWCAESRQKAMTRAKNNQAVESGDCDTSILDAHYAAVNELGLSGTPALLTQDGALIIGYRSSEELLKLLDSES